MRSILILSLVLLLTGCGEKFDASSDNMIAVSYNGILKTLDGQDKDRFIRQYRFYTEVYEGPYDPEDPGINMQQNDIESLHGLSYREVIDRVEEHVAYVESVSRDNDLALLRSLHKEYLKSRENMMLTMKEFPVTVQGVKGRYSDITASKVDIENNSDVIITEFDLHIRVIQRSTGEDAFGISDEVDLSSEPLEPGYIQTITFQNEDLQEYFNDKNYSIQSSITNIMTGDGRLIYAIMGNESFIEYASLMEKYPKEFESIQDEIGRPVI